MRFYPNQVKGEQKQKESFEIFLSGENHDENIHLITEVIHEEYKHEVLEISEKILANLAQ